MQVYTENLPHILNLLEVSAQSGTLSLTPALAQEDCSWQATALLQEGKMCELRVRRLSDGLILMGGQAALEFLTRQKGVYWHFKEVLCEAPLQQRTIPVEEVKTRKTPITHPYILKQQSEFNPAEIPRRTFLGSHLGIQGVPSHMWSREHRTVFLLINDTRSKEEILRLLPPNFARLLDMILRDLQSAGLIE